MTITIRNLTTRPGDIETANDILAAAFNPERDFRPELHRYLAFQPDGFFLAEFDGEPAGMGGAVNLGPFAYVGLVGTFPAMQRRGVAMAIMNHLLAWLDGVGCPLVVLDASPAGQPLYAQIGFAETRKVLTFKRTEPMPKSDIPANVQPMHASDVPEVADFDAPIFGARREHVLAAYAAANSGRCFLIRDSAGHLAGYLIAQHATFGPWVARDPDSAAALLQAACALPYGSTIRVLVPSTNEDDAKLLTAYGFQQGSALAYMQRGTLPEPGDHRLIYGQASHAIG